MKMKTLRRRLALTHALVALLAVFLVALLASGLIVRSYEDMVYQQNRVAREGLRVVLTQYYQRRGSWDNVGQFMDRTLTGRPFLDTRRVVLVDTNRRILFDSAGILEGRRALPRHTRLGIPIQMDEQTVGVIAVLEDATEAGEGFVRSITRMVLIGSGVGVSVAVLVAVLIARRVTRPLRSLTRAAHRLAAGERHEPLDMPDEVELADLSRSFNMMADELAHQEVLRRQFVADVAHELRTPLSVLRLQVEGLEDGVEAPTPELFASLREEVTLLTRLVEDLRLLSLADAGQLSLAVERLEVHQVLETAATAAAPRARQQGVDLHIRQNGNLPDIMADPQRIAQVLGNLLENAVRYTPQGGHIVLQAISTEMPGTNGPAVALDIADTGPGIAAENLSHIFDRFYRTDRARARETGGSGLGLAIVQRLVEAHGGQISVTSTPGKGTTFRVLLPAQAEK